MQHLALVSILATKISLYSATIPLFYKTKWENVHFNKEMKQPDNNQRTTESGLENTISDISRFTRKELHRLSTSFRPDLWTEVSNENNVEEPLKRKRALDFIGDFFSFCCGIATERKMNDLKIKTQRFKDFMQKMEIGPQKSLRDIGNSKKFEIYHDEVSTKFQKILMKYPQKLIWLTILDNYTLAIPLNKISRYYKLEICDCTVTDDTLIVHIKIPIVYQNKQWKLQELITTPVSWKNHTCTLMHEILYLSVSENDSETTLRSISGTGLHHCKPYADKLCFLPRHNTDTLYGPQCAYKMFLGSTIQELEEHCSFRCHASTSMIISEIQDDIFIVTHPLPDTIINCPDSQTKIADDSYGQPGALQISLPCHCSLLVNHEEVIAVRYPCSSQKAFKSKTINILPAVWSNFKTYEIKANEHNTVFHNISECLDNNWTTTVPHLNLSTSSVLSEIVSNLEKTLSESYNDLYTYQGDTTYLIWNVILTTLVLVLFYKIFRINSSALTILTQVVALEPEDKEIVEQSLTFSKWICLILFFMFIIIIALYFRCKRKNHITPRMNNTARWLSVVPKEPIHVAELERTREQSQSLSSLRGTEHIFVIDRRVEEHP
ncbi:hypothetical protein RI129_002734 [Pyrocoelia pectoralis]|uniref:Uncharacterized protein n=1 Tax=Pyrocoelia pectoralis TaxID=417401 RepID=A0AAN7ZMF3_9COLE